MVRTPAPISTGPLCSSVSCSDILTEFFHVADGQQAGSQLAIEAQVLVERSWDSSFLERGEYYASILDLKISFIEIE